MEEAGLRPSEFIDLFQSQVVSRHLDLKARVLKGKGQCFYTIGSSGHEGNAACGKVFGLRDMAFLHYRSGAFMVQRSKYLEGCNFTYDTLLSLVASSEDPIAGGRHKVWGSFPLNVPPQTSTIASHLPKAVGAALSIGRAKDLGLGPDMVRLDHDSLIVCSFGDASVNHSTAQGAFNAASWAAYQNIPIPLVFICEDNHIGISVPTPDHWIEASFSQRPGWLYLRADGLNLMQVYSKACQAGHHARTYKKPVFLHIDMVRLLGHAGSDVESTYRSLADIEKEEAQDPLLHSAREICTKGWLSTEEILSIYEEAREEVDRLAQKAVSRPKLTMAHEVRAALESCAHPKVSPPVAEEGVREKLFGRDYSKMKEPFHMAKLLNWALADILLQYPQALIFGEDVARKGGVYHVTDKLSQKFGQKRVFNSLLDETSILGSAIGLAHNGFLPLPEIQFLAYVHNAEDQIRGEAATLAFFSQGQFTNSMVVRIAGLAYQSGFGGHFHNDNSLAALRDIPGVVLAVPCRGDDAVKMLRSCVRLAHEKGRVVIFVEPIALYMTKDLYEEGDKKWSFSYPAPQEEISVGEWGTYGEGELCILTYGNGTYYSLQAKKVLEENHKVKAKVIDLRWVSPIDDKKLAVEIEGVRYLLIVDECRRTGSLGEALVSHLYEARVSVFQHTPSRPLPLLPKLKVLAADDCFIPLGVASVAGLPQRDDIVQASLELIS